MATWTLDFSPVLRTCPGKGPWIVSPAARIAAKRAETRSLAEMVADAAGAAVHRCKGTAAGTAASAASASPARGAAGVPSPAHAGAAVPPAVDTRVAPAEEG